MDRRRSAGAVCAALDFATGGHDGSGDVWRHDVEPVFEHDRTAYGGGGANRAEISGGGTGGGVRADREGDAAEISGAGEEPAAGEVRVREHIVKLVRENRRDAQIANC
jgi:hypothetical protein